MGVNEETLVMGQIGRLTWVKNHAKMFELAELAKKTTEKNAVLSGGNGRLERGFVPENYKRSPIGYVTFFGTDRANRHPISFV